MELSSLANSWVDSYLEALLTAGLSTEHIRDVHAQKGLDTDADRELAAKYYVQQVLALDEDSIRDAWFKATRRSGSKLSGEKDARMEQLSWRVWGMKRKREKVAAEVVSETQYVDEDDAVALTPSSLTIEEDFYPTNLRLELSRVQSDSSDDVLLLTDGTPTSPNAIGNRLLVDHHGPKFYVVMISMHGLVRGDRMELGKDPDTGGQVKYVVEVAKALSRHPAVHRVDLLTRLIRDPKVDKSYSVEEECLELQDHCGGAYICRIKCGPEDVYLRKEALWPYIREFADNAITHVRQTQTKLARVGEPCELYAIHGHYADAGEVAALLSQTLGVPMVMTGHSLGRNKLDHLLKSGTMKRSEIEATYAISRRIEAEERALDNALMVFTSTQQEVKDQWGLYDGYNAELERVVRMRHRKGRHFPMMMVIPPGLDFSNLKLVCPEDPWVTIIQQAKQSRGMFSPLLSPRLTPSGGDLDFFSPPSFNQPGSPPSTPMSPRSCPATPRAIIPTEDPPIWQEVFKFLRNPRKPVVLAMSRPDAKKNITTLVKAFGMNGTLREIANLVLVMGNRDVIDSMASGSQKVLEQVLKLVDMYNLYGSVAYPKRHSQSDISDIYMLATCTRGIFINPALQEPFGLTLIEAAAHGVPIVATKNGGPVDIVNTLKNGVLVDPTNPHEIAEALLKILTNAQLWDDLSTSGVNRINAYSWPSHCVKYLKEIETEKERSERGRRSSMRNTFSGSLDDLALLERPSDTDGWLDDFDAPSSVDVMTLSGSLSLDLPSPRPNHHHIRLPDVLGLGEDRAPAGEVTAGLRVMQEKYLVVLIDSMASLHQLAPVLSKKGRQMLGLGVAKSLGLGVLSMYPWGRTCQMMSQVGVALQELAFLVTNNGSEIWYPNGNEVSKAQLDEQYEHHIEYWWDKGAIKTVLAQCLTQRILLGKANSLVKSKDLDVLGTEQITDKVNHLSVSSKKSLPKLKVETDTGAHHMMVSLQLTEGMDLSASEALSMCNRVRRKFRRGGIRAQLAVQIDIQDDDTSKVDQTCAAPSVQLHVTPLRASRALALRFLANKHGVDMRNLTLVCAAGSLHGDVVGMPSSDLEEVVGGVQRVIIMRPQKQMPCELFSMDMHVYKYNQRVHVL